MTERAKRFRIPIGSALLPDRTSIYACRCMTGESLRPAAPPVGKPAGQAHLSQNCKTSRRNVFVLVINFQLNVSDVRNEDNLFCGAEKVFIFSYVFTYYSQCQLPA